jgi:hypothetical protein
MRWATATLLALAVLATPGCGGGGSGGSGSGQVKAEDASAKSDARVTVTALESCFIDTQAYALCAAPGKLDARGVRVVVGSPPAKGEVGVAGTERGYVVTSKSQSGTDFQITKLSKGPPRRTCSKADAGGCAPGGTW